MNCAHCDRSLSKRDDSDEYCNDCLAEIEEDSDEPNRLNP